MYGAQCVVYSVLCTVYSVHLSGVFWPLAVDGGRGADEMERRRGGERRGGGY